MTDWSAHQVSSLSRGKLGSSLDLSEPVSSYIKGEAHPPCQVGRLTRHILDIHKHWPLSYAMVVIENPWSPDSAWRASHSTCLMVTLCRPKGAQVPLWEQNTRKF